MPSLRSDGTLRLYQVDAFTRTRYEGNPAGVVPNADGLSAPRMQAIARELNVSETAFIFSPRADDHDVHVRFFTPTTEVPVCGHATIAAHYVRALEGAWTGGPVRQLTGAGILGVEMEPEPDGDFRIWMDQRRPEFGEALSGDLEAAVVEALGLESRDLGEGPVRIVSTGHSKLLVPVGSRERLNALQPDLARLAGLSRATGCNGYYPFALGDAGSGVVAHGRMFAPAIGIVEDPVTGNAAGPLGAYLVKHGIVRSDPGTGTFSGWVRQGEALGRPGRVQVVVRAGEDGTPVAVRIAGEAVIAFRSVLES